MIYKSEQFWSINLLLFEVFTIAGISYIIDI